MNPSKQNLRDAASTTQTAAKSRCSESSLLFVPIDPNIAESQRFMDLMDALALDDKCEGSPVGPVSMAFGIIGMLLSLAGRKPTVHGDIGPLRPRHLARLCDWRHDPDEFVAGLVISKWVVEHEGGLRVEGFERHAGKAMVARANVREQTRLRVERHRARKKEELARRASKSARAAACDAMAAVRKEAAVAVAPPVLEMAREAAREDTQKSGERQVRNVTQIAQNNTCDSVQATYEGCNAGVTLMYARKGKGKGKGKGKDKSVVVDARESVLPATFNSPPQMSPAATAVADDRVIDAQGFESYLANVTGSGLSLNCAYVPMLRDMAPFSRQELDRGWDAVKRTPGKPSAALLLRKIEFIRAAPPPPVGHRLHGESRRSPMRMGFKDADMARALEFDRAMMAEARA